MSKNWCFWTVCSRRLLRVRWTARRSNQSILKEISTEYSLKGMTDAEAEPPILWYEELTHWKRPWCWGKIEGRRRGWQRMRWWDDRGWDGWMASPILGVGDGQGNLACCSPWHSVRHNWETELTDWFLYLTNMYLVLSIVRNSSKYFNEYQTNSFSLKALCCCCCCCCC